MTGSTPPRHLVPDAPGDGVALYAGQVAAAVGAATAGLDGVLALPRQRVHVHVSDRLFGPTCEVAADRLLQVIRRHPTTLTLHDLPQPEDGAAFARRAHAYGAVARASDGWVTSSHHEAELARRHLGGARPAAVIPLPVMPLAHPPPRRRPAVEEGSTAVVGLLGWVYPGKGHLEVLRACAGLPYDVVVRALGRTSRGHEPLGRRLAERARELGIVLEVTGWVADDDLVASLHGVDVPLAAHRKVSASGSLNSWIAAGRRPLVTTGTYSREMSRTRPGTLTLIGAEPAAMRESIVAALRDPGSTWLSDEVSTRPDLADVAGAYLRWWSQR